MSAHSPRPSRPPRTGFPWALLLLAVLIVIAGWYFWQQRSTSASSSPSAGMERSSASGHGNAESGAASGVTDPGRAALAGGDAAEGSSGVGGLEPGVPTAGLADESAGADSTPAGEAPRFPLRAGDGVAGSGTLPEAGASDPSILEALLTLASRETLARFVNLQDFARRFVVTVDHLPRQRVPGQWNALRPVPGPLVIADDDDGRMILQEDNFRRYDAFLQFAEALDPAAVARIYRHFYPLLQEQYQALGYPQGYLNDRVVAAIDDMLTAPAVTGPIVLVQPRVQYRFEDPALESLSAGRKIMIRIGPDHAARLQRILRAWRAQIVDRSS